MGTVYRHQALPANLIHVVLYLNHMLENKFTHSVLSSVFDAISWVHQINGHLDPTANCFVTNLLEASMKASC